jgi:hypothetical protein
LTPSGVIWRQESMFRSVRFGYEINRGHSQRGKAEENEMQQPIKVEEGRV